MQRALAMSLGRIKHSTYLRLFHQILHHLFIPSTNIWASLVAQMVKSLPAMWETPVQSLGQEDPLEKEMKTHSRIVA